MATCVRHRQDPHHTTSACIHLHSPHGLGRERHQPPRIKHRQLPRLPARPRRALSEERRPWRKTFPWKAPPPATSRHDLYGTKRRMTQNTLQGQGKGKARARARGQGGAILMKRRRSTRCSHSCKQGRHSHTLRVLWTQHATTK